MGTITARKRKDGTSGFTAQIRIKRAGEIVHTEAQTFDRRATASAWLKKREVELDQPGVTFGRKKTDSPTLSDAIDKYVLSHAAMGRTKAQVLGTLRTFDIAEMDCAAITSTDLVALATELGDGRKPQTVGNYMSHLQSVFAVASDAWDFPLDIGQMAKAMRTLRKLGNVTKSAKRDRRPTLDEMNRIMTHLQEVQAKRPSTMPGHRVTAFALFSTRRQEEIARIRWTDYEGDRVLVRDMKHPGQKVGNHVWVNLPEEAQQIINAMPRVTPEIFPFKADTVGAAFARACAFLGIEDLTFHDLRHEGISRLFEIGLDIPRASQVSGHRSWGSLQRYTHIRQTGDKYADWPWLDVVSAPVAT